MTAPTVPALGPDEAHVWWAHARSRSSEILSWLDPVAATRHSTLRRAADRDRFGSAHALARIVLAGYLQLPYPEDIAIRVACKHCGAAGHGKPELAVGAGQFTFSLAYAGARVGVAVTRVPVGLDVVMTGDADDPARAAALAPEESSRLADRPAAARPHDLARTWVRKEAVLKATGDGLAVPLSDLVVTGPEQDPALISWSDGPEATNVQLADLLPGAGHVAAIALLGSCEPGEPPWRILELDAEPLLTEAEPPSIA